MAHDHSPRRRSHNQRTTPDADAQPSCLALWLQGPDGLLTRFAASGALVLPALHPGRLLTELWPAAAPHILPLVQQALSTHMPVAHALAAASAIPFTFCACVPLPTDPPSVLCTLSDVVSHDPATNEAQPEPAQDLVAVARQCVAQVKRAFNAASAQIALLNPSAPYELRAVAVAGLGRAAEGRVLARASLPGRIIADDKALRLARADFIDALHEPWIREEIARAHASAFLGVPLHDREGRVFGAIMCQRTETNHPFTADDERRLHGLANEYASRVRDAQLADAPDMNARLMAMVDALPVGVLWSDGFGEIIYANRRQQEYSSYHEGDILSPTSTAIHPYWRHENTHAPYRVNDLPIPQSIIHNAPQEAILIKGDRPEAPERAILVDTQLLHDAAGQITDVIAVQVNITLQYRAEQVARHRTEDLEAVVESITDGIILYDAQGQMIHFNQAALKIMGWDTLHRDPRTMSEAERFAIYDYRVGGGQSVPVAQTPLHRALAGETVHALPGTFHRPDGAIMATESSAAPLRDRVTGEIRGVVAVVHDITDKYQLTKMQEDFLGIASHELRTPLTSLILAGRLLQRRLSKLEQAGDLMRLGDDIVSQAKRLTLLTNNILTLTRLTGERMQLTVTPVDFAHIMHVVVDDQRTVGKRDIQVIGAKEPLLGTADSERLTQALANLLHNAIKYSGATTPITVRLQRRLLVGDVAGIRITIRDYGKGVAKARLRELLERAPTFTDDLTTPLEQQDRGLGLGLVITRAIIAAHRGRLWAKSVEGEGSTFGFDIPLEQDSHE